MRPTLTTVIQGEAGRRERRKAQTRAEVRETAQQLFAERGFEAVTIADVAAAADVAVQTVFNHFDSKEALFFDGRTPWVEETVAAVSARPPGSDPVAALRSHLEVYLVVHMANEARPESRAYIEALERTPALQSRERMLVEETAHRVADALGAAIAAGDWPAAPVDDPEAARVLSRLVADLFLVAARVLVLENRRTLLRPCAGQPEGLTPEAATTSTLAELERCVSRLAPQLLAGPPGRRSA